MSALMKNSNIANDNSSVTSISANSRIDYILRFSKQAILVVDHTNEGYSAVSSQFLASLPDQHNAAFISLSAKFNDIQIRCRIIEQLFASELFDPELSLAVSIVNYAKKTNQAISIVVENAHHLSLQLIHELCQLAQIAKKSQLNINVVMLGAPLAGHTVAMNKALFQNNLAILSANNGQLLSMGDRLFKAEKNALMALLQHKWLLVFVAFLLSLMAVVFILLQQDSFNFAKPLQEQQNIKVIAVEQVLAEPTATVLTVNNSRASGNTGNVVTAQSAAVSDIYTSLINPISAPVKTTIVLPATNADIVNAIAMFEHVSDKGVDKMVTNVETKSRLTNNKDTIMAEKLSPLTRINSAANESTLKSTQSVRLSVAADHNYYLSQSGGVVIQFAAFSETGMTEDFVKALSTVEHHVYQRMLNDKPLLVITSEYFSERDLAVHALSQLPADLLRRNPWIKSIDAINKEIIAFQDSQK